MYKILNFLFGFEYVYLRIMSDGFKLVRARLLFGRLYAAPYRQETTKELLPGGGVHAGGYVLEWRPVTAKTNEYYIKTNNDIDLVDS